MDKEKLKEMLEMLDEVQEIVNILRTELKSENSTKEVQDGTQDED